MGVFMRYGVMAQRKKAEVDIYATQYLTFESPTNNITITPKYNQPGVSLQYSINEGSNWYDILPNSTTSSSKKILFRGKATGNKTLWSSLGYATPWVIDCASANINIYGNINTLLDDDYGSWNLPTTLDNYTFYYIFYQARKIINAENLVLPATTLANYSYGNMFGSCSYLLNAPKLPATTLSDNCYNSMFNGCSKLTTTVPELPATTLKSNCYAYMFKNCSDIKFSETQTGIYQTPWIVPATEDVYYWNRDMFVGTGGTFKSNPKLNTTYYHT